MVWFNLFVGAQGFCCIYFIISENLPSITVPATHLDSLVRCENFTWGPPALLEGLRRMQRRGLTRCLVPTGENNTPAILLYESVGFWIVNWLQKYCRMAETAGFAPLDFPKKLVYISMYE